MKRSDQYRIDPREGGATDYKFYSKYPEDAEPDDRVFSESEHEVREGTNRAARRRARRRGRRRRRPGGRKR